MERLGARGAVLHRPGQDRLQVPAAVPPGPVADSNGAGDTHLGALPAGLADGLDGPAALALAGRAAAWSLTRPGGACGPTRAELERSGRIEG